MRCHAEVGGEVGVLVADALDERDGFGDLDGFGDGQEVEVAFHDLAGELLDDAHDDGFRVLVLRGVQVEPAILVSEGVPRVLLVLLE